MENCDVLVVGAGAAGLSAAKMAYRCGCPSVWLVDTKPDPGGVLRQCAHHGFAHGQTGPDMIQQLLADFPSGIRYLPRTTVLSIHPQREAELCGPAHDHVRIGFHQLVLAAGCYEIAPGELLLGGTRPQGVYMAGQMQEMMNLEQRLPPGPVVILGSGDLGLIMAAHLAAQRIPVTLVEKREACGGLKRNQTCLDNPWVTLYCQSSIQELCGDPLLTGVVLTDGRHLPCRTLLIAVGLRPERSLIESMACPPWLHLAGNCRAVKSMVEAVVADGEKAGLESYRRWKADHDGSAWESDYLFKGFGDGTV